MTEKTLRFLKSVDSLPPHFRNGQASFYDDVIREFIFSGARYAEIKDLGKKPMTVLVGIRNRLMRRKDNIRVFLRNKKVYLERLNSIEQHTLPQIPANGRAPPTTEVAYDMITLLGTTIVKARCSRCKALNGKDSRVCRECGYDLYPSEGDYQRALSEMESVEKSLNCEK